MCFSVCRVHQISPVRDFAAGSQSKRGCVALVYNLSGRGGVVVVYEPVCMCVLVVCTRWNGWKRQGGTGEGGGGLKKKKKEDGNLSEGRFRLKRGDEPV